MTAGSSEDRDRADEARMRALFLAAELSVLRLILHHALRAGLVADPNADAAFRTLRASVLAAIPHASLPALPPDLATSVRPLLDLSAQAFFRDLAPALGIATAPAGTPNKSN